MSQRAALVGAYVRASYSQYARRQHILLKSPLGRMHAVGAVQRSFASSALPGVAEMAIHSNGESDVINAEVALSSEENAPIGEGIEILSESVQLKSVEASDPAHIQAAMMELDFDVEEVPVDDVGNFGLHPKLVKQLRRADVNKLFPVQAETVQNIIDGNDVIVRSRTGSGKTLAFVLPILHRLFDDGVATTRGNGKRSNGSNAPMGLVITPTRELALQISREFERVGQGASVVSVYGGAPISQQARQLRNRPDVVVGTPGRIFDFLNQGILDLSQVKVAVLDEADEMLNIGFLDAVTDIFAHLPDTGDRQNLLFSATMPPRIQQLSRTMFNNPQLVDLIGSSSPSLPKEVSMYKVFSQNKVASAASVIQAFPDAKGVLVFSNTKAEADRFPNDPAVTQLGLRVGPLHGGMTQAHRERTLRMFRNGEYDCLVATDVAARGLDIPEVDLVVHMSYPTKHEAFIHRTGRTGRAGRKGACVVVVDRSDMFNVAQVEKILKREFETLKSDGVAKTLVKLSEKKFEMDNEKMQISPFVTDNVINAMTPLASKVHNAVMQRFANKELSQEQTIAAILAFCTTQYVPSLPNGSVLNGDTSKVSIEVSTLPEMSAEKPVPWLRDNAFAQVSASLNSNSISNKRTVHATPSPKTRVGANESFLIMDLHPKDAGRLLQYAQSTSPEELGYKFDTVFDIPEWSNNVHGVQAHTPRNSHARGDRRGRGRYNGDRNSGGGQDRRGGRGGFRRGGGGGGDRRGGRGGDRRQDDQASFRSRSDGSQKQPYRGSRQGGNGGGRRERAPRGNNRW